MRKIEIRTNDENHFRNFFEANPQTVNNALSYLSMWNLHYRYVYIFIHSDGEMTASYYQDEEAYRAQGRPGYVIGAIFHEEDKTYSFHS